MTAKSEYEAAYFTLLRAREEFDNLQRYREYLDREALRLDRFIQETRALVEAVAPRVRRTIDQTQKPLIEAAGRRRSVALDELGRMDDRMAAAAAFVEECELEVSALRA